MQMLLDFHCKGCGGLLFRGQLRDAIVEIKCRKNDCRLMNVIDKTRVAVVS